MATKIVCLFLENYFFLGRLMMNTIVIRVDEVWNNRLKDVPSDRSHSVLSYIAIYTPTFVVLSLWIAQKHLRLQPFLIINLIKKAPKRPLFYFFSFFSSFSLSSPSFPNFFKFHLCIQNHFTKISSQRIALSRSLQQEITTIATSALSRYVAESSAKSVHFSAFTICQVWAPIAGSTLTLSCHSFATWDWTVSRNDLASWVDYVITLIAIEAGESVEVKVLAKRIDLLTMIRMQVVALIAWSTSIIGPNKTSRFIDGLTSTGVSYHEARITLQTFITCDIVVPT